MLPFNLYHPRLKALSHIDAPLLFHPWPVLLPLFFSKLTNGFSWVVELALHLRSQSWFLCFIFFPLEQIFTLYYVSVSQQFVSAQSRGAWGQYLSFCVCSCVGMCVCVCVCTHVCMLALMIILLEFLLRFSYVDTHFHHPVKTLLSWLAEWSQWSHQWNVVK